MLIKATIALLPLMASAHVKLRYSYKNEGPSFPIRNAPGPYADGIFSTAGPCGGEDNWGRNGFTNMTDDGRSLTLKISYNGGHQSAANNFRMAFLCVPVGQGIPEIDLKRSTGRLISNCPAVPSPDGTIDPPYTVTCNLPKQNLTGNQVKECTVSVLDQRDWGGCNDIRLTALPAPPQRPPAAFILPPKSVAYQIQQNVQTAKVHVKCNKFLGSSLEVKVLTSTTKNVKFDVLVTGHLCLATGTCWENAVVLKIPDNPKAVAYTGLTTIHGEQFQIDYINNNPNPNLLTFTNIQAQSPTICDGIFYDVAHCEGCTTNMCPCNNPNNAPVNTPGVAGGGVVIFLVIGGVITVYILIAIKKLNITKITTPGIFKITVVVMRLVQLVLSIATFSVAGHWAITRDGLGDIGFRFIVAVSVLIFLTLIPWIVVDALKTTGPDTYHKIVKNDKCRAYIEFAFDLFWSVVLMVTVAAISTYPGVGVSSAEFLGSLTALWFLWFSFLISQIQSTVVLCFAKEWTDEVLNDQQDDKASPRMDETDNTTYGSTDI